MKRCGYCGRDNEGEATACRECGTEFAAEMPGTTTALASEAVEPAPDTPVELQRCRDLESLTQITGILEAAGIAYQRSSLPKMFELGKIGAADEAEVVVSVPRELYDAARAAMESAYLNTKLPEDHYLLTSTDEELIEIVAQSSEWSALDGAHAKRLMGERGIDTKRIEDKRAEHLQQLRLGRPAPKKLTLFGWLFSVLGGLIGLGIAWSLCYMKEKTLDGEFPTYDEKSRAVGQKMLRVAIIAFAGALFLGCSHADWKIIEPCALHLTAARAFRSVLRANSCAHFCAPPPRPAAVGEARRWAL
jgi:hypothetical protein